jgi:hypothetical protein
MSCIVRECFLDAFPSAADEARTPQGVYASVHGSSARVIPLYPRCFWLFSNVDRQVASTRKHLASFPSVDTVTACSS